MPLLAQVGLQTGGVALVGDVNVEVVAIGGVSELDLGWTPFLTVRHLSCGKGATLNTTPIVLAV